VGNRSIIKLGDKEVDYNPEFRTPQGLEAAPFPCAVERLSLWWQDFI